MSIFVSIACLLDNDIINTINDCIDKAKNPDIITIGVCYQKDYNKDDILAPLEKLYNVKVIRVPWKNAQGPMIARNKILSLITDEEYFLQIDCHTRFFDHWDQKIVDEYKSCLKQSNQPIISYYPININNMKNPIHTSKIYHICTFREISKNGIKTSGKSIYLPKEPLKGIGISAAMLFMNTKTILDNPIDPNLPFALQSGEQVLYATRLWTRGYDFFTPTQHIISTEYITNRDRVDIKYRRYLNIKSGKWRKPVWEKVKYLLGLSPLVDTININIIDIDKWGAGSVRTLKEYWEITGIYTKLKEIYPYML